MLRSIAVNPVAVFIVLSAVFGSAIIAAAPPLRGPDESQHFLRALGLAQGDVVPSMQDEAGRKGILLPLSFHRDFSLFIPGKAPIGGIDSAIYAFSRRTDTMRASPHCRHRKASERAYAGAEGYSPAAYLPQAAAALLARAADLGFLPTFYLMRIAGFTA